MAIRRRLLSEFLVPLILALGAAVPLFYQIVVLSSQQPDNFDAFYSFSSGIDGYEQLKTAWRTRLFSNVLAWEVDRASAFVMSRVDIRYINRPQPFAVALWTAGWFMAIAVVFTLFLKRRAVFYIFGTYAALTFGYMPKLPTTRVYPWDMPALFVFVLFMFLFVHNRFKWMLLLLPLAMGFKETAAVLCILFLTARELSAREKRWMFPTAAVICVVVKLGIDTYTRSASPIFTMETGLGSGLGGAYFFRNLGALGSWPTYLINAGTLLAFFLVPAGNAKIAPLRLIAVLFAIGNFVFGTVLEYRIWFEMIPFALYAIESSA